MRRRTLATTVAAVVTCVTGCTGQDAPPRPAPEAEPTTLASYDAGAVSVVRGPFCDLVSPTGIEHALGDAPEAHDSWDNGDRTALPDGTRDRVHEYGCTWTAPDGTEASAWVFAPPVTGRQARALARAVVPRGCWSTRGAGLGSPSVTWRCTGDGVTEESYGGLLEDAWLTCALSTPDEPVALPERTSAWCVSVLEAARA